MRGVRHLLFSRFNLRPWKGSRPEQHLDETWLRARLDLFARTTAPCVASQTVQDFEWFLFIDPATPQWVRDELLATAVRSHLIEVSTGEMQSEARAHAKDAVGEASVLVTTRIDSDDSIARTFLERVRTIAVETPGYVCFRDGYQLDVATGHLFEMTWPSNSMMSLAEPAGPDLVTVHSGQHHKLRPVTNVPDERMWVRGIHDSNVSGRLRPGRPVHPRELGDRFAIDPSLIRRVGPVRSTARRVRWIGEGPARAAVRRVRSR